MRKKRHGWEMDRKANLIFFLGKRTGREQLLELGQIDGEVNAALRAGEPGQTVGHIEDGLAVCAGDLDLRGIDAVGRHVLLRRS
jgi:hypothetical protein